jgi:hypothetical protein
MRGFFSALRSLTKEHVQVAAGLATVLGGIIGAVTFFGGLAGGGAGTPASAAVTQVAGVQGEFLKVQFGAVQDPSTLLPGGPTVGPDGELQVCAGQDLFAWVEHTYKNGTVLQGVMSNRDGVIFRADVPVDERASNFWISARVSTPGIHTLNLKVLGTDESVSWKVNVVCAA